MEGSSTEWGARSHAVDDTLEALRPTDGNCADSPGRHHVPQRRCAISSGPAEFAWRGSGFLSLPVVDHVEELLDIGVAILVGVPRAVA